MTKAGLVILMLVGAATAHDCEDGSRVVCHNVEHAEQAPSTNGDGYQARGYPMTFPDGKRVYCLVDHDYHTCGAGEAACCADGTKPWHSEQGPRDKVKDAPKDQEEEKKEENEAEAKVWKQEDIKDDFCYNFAETDKEKCASAADRGCAWCKGYKMCYLDKCLEHAGDDEEKCDAA